MVRVRRAGGAPTARGGRIPPRPTLADLHLHFAMGFQLGVARLDSAAGRGWGALRTVHPGRQTHREHGEPARHTQFHAHPEGGGGGGRATAGGRSSDRFPRLRGYGEGYCQGAITLAAQSGEPPSNATGLSS
ncbi:hypothetical protein chiPu_0026043 [Chiloscyllium punctatum]|uniref:Uncharacterized protein n=1 Tax=Chiloscyllium punctatum TaxID=137246 RepID=A0A401TIK5_CHIPU|nr:hypothetical protein [Chiloscyllium punctatum]